MVRLLRPQIPSQRLLSLRINNLGATTGNLEGYRVAAIYQADRMIIDAAVLG